MDQLSIGGVPAMGEQSETGALEFSPGKVQQRPPVPINPCTRHTGGVDQRGSMAMTQQVLAETGAALEALRL